MRAHSLEIYICINQLYVTKPYPKFKALHIKTLYLHLAFLQNTKRIFLKFVSHHNKKGEALDEQNMSKLIHTKSLALGLRHQGIFCFVLF